MVRVSITVMVLCVTRQVVLQVARQQPEEDQCPEHLLLGGVVQWQGVPSLFQGGEGPVREG